jgi:hypothetical protein
VNCQISIRGSYEKPEFVAWLREADYPDVPRGLEGTGPTREAAIADLERKVEEL